MPAREYVTLDQLLPLVLRDCLNVPRALALHEIREAAIKFCIDSRYWREDIVPVNTIAGVAEYEVFTHAPESRIVFILSLQADGQPLTAKTEEELDNDEPLWRTKEGKPSRFIAPAESWVRPIPTAVDVVALTGRAVVAPTVEGNYLLKDLYNNHARAIASLAKAELMKMPLKPWTNEQMALFEAGRGQAGIDKAKVQAARNFAASPKRRARAYYQ